MTKALKKRKKRSQTAVVAAQPYVPSDKERAALSLMIDRIEQGPAHAAATVEVSDGIMRLGWDHPSEPVAAVLWANALGTSDLMFAATLLDQIAQVARTGTNLTESELNRMMAIVRGLRPTDPTEALLAAQMAAVHSATMVAARRLTHVETLQQQDCHSTSLNKLARTFAAQVEALKRYRTGGVQTIKVQHVTVNDGGQAIVGDVQHTGGILKSERQSHELAASDALGPALLGPVQANRQPMPSPGREGKVRVPVSRGTSRSTEGQSQRSLPARAPHQ